MDVQDVHARLRAAGRTLADLGEVLGLSHGQVSRLLRGKARMRLDVMKKIEAYLATLEKHEARVEEERASYTPAPSAIRFVTLEEARAMKQNPPPRPTKEELDRAREELRELSAALRAAPLLTDMSDDELLGYDET